VFEQDCDVLQFGGSRLGSVAARDSFAVCPQNHKKSHGNSNRKYGNGAACPHFHRRVEWIVAADRQINREKSRPIIEVEAPTINAANKVSHNDHFIAWQASPIEKIWFRQLSQEGSKYFRGNHRKHDKRDK
jgi:hypothetical protein